MRERKKVCSLFQTTISFSDDKTLQRFSLDGRGNESWSRCPQSGLRPQAKPVAGAPREQETHSNTSEPIVVGKVKDMKQSREHCKQFAWCTNSFSMGRPCYMFDQLPSLFLHEKGLFLSHSWSQRVTQCDRNVLILNIKVTGQALQLTETLPR